jgi:hypothetical protein
MRRDDTDMMTISIIFSFEGALVQTGNSRQFRSLSSEFTYKHKMSNFDPKFYE